jgi:hypothetical protein
VPHATVDLILAFWGTVTGVLGFVGGIVIRRALRRYDALFAQVVELMREVQKLREAHIRRFPEDLTSEGPEVRILPRSDGG